MEALNIRQLMSLSKILKKMGLRFNLTDWIFGEKFNDQIKTMDSNSTKQDLVYVNIVVFIMENMFLAEKEIYQLFAEINKTTIEKVRNYTIDELLISIDNLIKGALPKNYRAIAELALNVYKKKIIKILDLKGQK